MTYCSLLINKILQRLNSPRWPLLVYATVWTSLLTLTVLVASVSPELAFVSAITPTSLFSRACRTRGRGGLGLVLVRLPFDDPGEMLCLPAEMFKKSKMDLLVPPVFAAVIVATSAYVVRALGLWEVDEETQ